jgi:L-iditol 2-dehydrogenase
MSQRALVEASLLHRVPDALPSELAAVVEPLAVATHAVLARSGVRAGDQALVLGPGPIGLFVAQVARAAGARVVVAGIEADQEVRLATAGRLGFGTINVEREALSAGLERLTGEPKVDLIYECAGSGAAVASALEATHKGGTIVLVALYSGPIQAELAWTVRRELSILASYGATWDDFERSIAFLDRGVVDARSIISTYPLRDGARAFDDALAQRVLKPVLLP